MTRSALNEAINDFHAKLVNMNDLVIEAIHQSVSSLISFDVERAKQIKDNDRLINDLRWDIEEGCIQLLATQQPVAGDLREIVSLINIVSELERIGDYAAGIAKVVMKIKQGLNPTDLKEIQEMSVFAAKMVDDAVNAYIKRDQESALTLLESDDELDKKYRKLQKLLIKQLKDESELAKQISLLLRVCQNLERMGDRATNISERVIYLITGEFQEKY